MEKLNVPILLATGRQGRRSEAVARHALAKAQEFGFESPLVDVKQYGKAFTINAGEPNPKIEFWREIVSRAHGLIIISPEYNRGYPGELKLMLDALYDEYEGLPVGVCAVSDGAISGARMLENLRPVLIAFKMVPLQRAVYINVAKEFDAAGQPTDPSVDKQMKGLFEQLQKFAKVLKAVRPALLRQSL